MSSPKSARRTVWIWFCSPPPAEPRRSGAWRRSQRRATGSSTSSASRGVTGVRTGVESRVEGARGEAQDGHGQAGVRRVRDLEAGAGAAGCALGSGRGHCRRHRARQALGAAAAAAAEGLARPRARSRKELRAGSGGDGAKAPGTLDAQGDSSRTCSGSSGKGSARDVRRDVTLRWADQRGDDRLARASSTTTAFRRMSIDRAGETEGVYAQDDSVCPRELF